MKNKELSIWLMIITSIICLILFGFLIGKNSQEVNINSLLASNASTTLLGAIVGSILGAFGTFQTVLMTQENDVKKLKHASYDEAKHILLYLCTYLKNVVDEYNEGIIDLNEEGVVIHGPTQIDFSVFNALHIELIKKNSILNSDQRVLIHNMEKHIDSIFQYDNKRINRNENLVYEINTSVSLNIIHRLSIAIFNINNFVEDKDSFSFKETDDENMMKAAFKLSKIENSEDVIEKILKKLDSK
ncbi:hypothetical protein [Vibrio diazotrophicus]|uniref:hypothetical protein n=1 Tax=Vibrio diazotrophicus TaxID=685 RepID=UPI000C9E8D16|nr:hypothetical protein [Vibrio diazotrophicus]PNH87215.1 hypothetical protein C1M59_21760 [Vibrio diazotrophicus]